MADLTITVIEDGAHAQSVALSDVVTVIESSPHEWGVQTVQEFVFKPATGPGLSDPLNLLEDPGAEDPDREIKAWFDGTDDNVMTAGWSYSTDDPRSGVYSLKAEPASSGLTLYNRSLVTLHPDEHLYVEIWVKATSSAGTAGSLFYGVEWLDEDRVSIDTDEQSIAASGATSYTQLLFTALAPAAAAFVRFYLRIDSISTHAWYVDDCFFSRTLPGRIIHADSNLAVASISTTGLIESAAGIEGADVSASNFLSAGAGLVLGGSTSGATTLEAQAVASGTVSLPNGPGTLALLSDVTASAFTDEKAQDAVGSMLADTATIDLTYTDATPELKADVKDDSVTNAKLSNMATKTYKGRTSGSTGDPEDVAVATLKTDLALVKGDVGLGNVDNTSDANKPVSTAQQTALDLKQNLLTNSAGLAAALSDETGTGAAVFASSPAFLGTPNLTDTRPIFTFTVSGDAILTRVGSLAAKSTHITCNANFTGSWSQDNNARASMLFNLNCITAGSEAFNIISIAAGSTTPVTRFVVAATGNIGIGTSSFGTSAVGVLAIANGTPPASSPANLVQLYAEDVAASSELKVRDEAGNIVTLSPHAKDAPEWLYDEEDLQPPHITREANVYAGRIRFVNHTRAQRLQQMLFDSGPLPKSQEKRRTIHEETFDEYNKRHGLKVGDAGYLVKEDWDGNQEQIAAEVEEKRKNWNKEDGPKPAVYKKKKKPGFVK